MKRLLVFKGTIRLDKLDGFKRSSFGLLLSLLLAGSIDANTSLDSNAVRAAAEYSKRHRGVSFLAIQNGRILLEQNAKTPHRIYSGTKAFWDFAALAATEDGLFDLDDRVADTISAWRDNPRKSQVTIRQLLNFDAGLEPLFFLHEKQLADRDIVAQRARMVAKTGTAFIYGPAALQVFHEIFKAKVRKQSPTHFLERRVLHRLGLGPQRYLPDRAGNPLLATGWILTARQWAKMGQVVLDNGAPVISRKSLEQCWRGTEANRAFSLGWWNNRAAPNGREVDVEQMLIPKWPNQDWRDACLCQDAPSDLVACIGSEGQRLYVIPSLELIAVRQADGGSFSDARFLRLLLGRESR
ncbi:MAG TPA: serine hydrolase [Chthoniobacterales bacterium]|nr:serine hydrolase [Chthoniobacterales bacterium]